MSATGKDAIRTTIIVPMYNCASYLERCLDSVCAQGEGVEVICIDDGSSDDTAAVAEHFAQSRGEVSVVRKENGGAGSARNVGIDRACGEYVCFVDSDDYILPGAIDALYARAKRDELDILYYDASVEYEDEGLARDYPGDVRYFHRLHAHEEVRTGRQLMVDLCREEGWRVSPVLQFVRRGLFEEAGLRFPEGVCNEDNAYTAYALFAARRVAHVTDCWYVRCLRHGSIMTSGVSPASLRGNFRAYWDVVSFVAGRSDLTVEEYEAFDNLICFLRARTREHYEHLLAEGRDPFSEFTLGERFSFEQTLRTYAELENLRAPQPVPHSADGVALRCKQAADDSEDTAARRVEAAASAPAPEAHAALASFVADGGPAACSAAFAQRFWGQPARFWRMFGEAPVLAPSPRDIRTVGVYYHRMGMGGAERVVAFLCKVWCAMGLRVVLFTDEEPKPGDFEVPAAVERVVLPLFFDVNAENYIGRATLFADALVEQGVDAMVYHQWWSHVLPWDMLTCKLAGVPFSVYTHGAFHCLMREGHPIDVQLPQVYGYADAVFALDRPDKAFWEWFNPRVLQTVNPVTIAPEAARRAPLASHEIVWVGRLDPYQKQPEEALRIMKQVRDAVPDARLTMVGPAPDGSVMDGLLALARGLGIEDCVEFAGGQRDVSPYLERASVYLSTSCLEGWYLTLAEAQARGLPSVIYELPYLELTREGRGMLSVRQGDATGAAAAIVRLLGDERARADLADEAFSHMQELAGYDYAAFWTDAFAEIGRGDKPQRPDEDVEIAWDMITEAHLHAIEKAGAEADRLRMCAECARREADGARAWSDEVEHSTSFRVGSVITAIPRYFKDLARRER